MAIKALEQEPSDDATLKDIFCMGCEYKEQEQQPCDDCISRKDMLAVLRQSQSLTQAWDGFEKLPSVTPKEKTGWIPVNERLPEDCQRVLVTVVRYNGNSIVRVAEYYSRNNGKGIFQIQENSEQWEVGEKGLLAWMPLPKPYEPQESEDKE